MFYSDFELHNFCKNSVVPSIQRRALPDSVFLDSGKVKYVTLWSAGAFRPPLSTFLQVPESLHRGCASRRQSAACFLPSTCLPSRRHRS